MIDAAWARRLARALLGDEGAGDDAIQDAWFKTAGGAGAEVRERRGWLRTMVANRLRDNRRAERRRRDREQVGSVAALPVISPEELVGRAEVQKTLAAMVASLPEPARAVIHLRYYEGLEPKEIAARLGVPDGTVRWRLKTAVDELRARLEKHYAAEKQDWRRALTPLLPIVPADRGTPAADPGLVGGGRLWAVAAGSILALALLGAGVRRCGGGGEETKGQAPDRARASRSAAASGSGRRGEHPLQGATVALPTACPEEVASLQGNLQRAQLALDYYMRPDLAWEEAPADTHNAVAVTVLEPLVHRYLDALGAPRERRSLDCRRDACVARVEEPWPPKGAWSQRTAPPSERAELEARTRMLKLNGPERALRPLELATVAVTSLWFRLHDSTGNPAHQPPPALPARILPSAGLAASSAANPGQGTEECWTQVRKLENALERTRQRATSVIDVSVLFGSEAPNPLLTWFLQDNVDRILQEVLPSFSERDRTSLVVACRGLVCAISQPDGARFTKELADRVIGDDRVKRHIRRSSMVTTNGKLKEPLHLVLLPPAADSNSGEDVLRAFLNRLRSGGLTTCQAKLPAEGELTMRFLLPAAGEVNDDGVPGRISFRLGGRLAETPFGRCVAEAVAAAAASFELPEGVTRHEMSKTLDLPLAATP